MDEFKNNVFGKQTADTTNQFLQAMANSGYDVREVAAWVNQQRASGVHDTTAQEYQQKEWTAACQKSLQGAAQLNYDKSVMAKMGNTRNASVWSAYAQLMTEVSRGTGNLVAGLANTVVDMTLGTVELGSALIANPGSIVERWKNGESLTPASESVQNAITNERLSHLPQVERAGARSDINQVTFFGNTALAAYGAYEGIAGLWRGVTNLVRGTGKTATVVSEVTKSGDAERSRRTAISRT